MAVIVVLAVIALIAVPIVLNIIKQARVGAAESSARNYIKAVETYTVAGELDKSKTALKNNQKYNVTTTTTVDGKTYEAINDLVEIKGTKPSGSEDYVTLDDTSSVTKAKLTINGYEVVIENNEIVSTTPGGKDETNNDNNSGSSGDSSENKNEGTIVASSENYKVGEKYQLTTSLSNTDSITGINWTSSNEDFVTIDGTGLLTIKSAAGSATITAKALSGQKATISFSLTDYLSNAVSVGDYVAYDVTPAGKGWRILSVNKSTNTVTIVHAGSPENYSHGMNASASVTALNNLAQKYKDDTYADNAHAMTKSEVDAIAQSSDLRNIGSYYWLASPYGSDLWNVTSTGLVDYGRNSSYGVRPVVVLKSNIKTTGKVKDAVGNDAWNLVK